MTDKICMVTGAAAGIDEETAKGLARLGLAVIIVCRNQEKANQS